VQYNFEWNPNKAQSNIEKHGITFEEAATVFLDILHISVFDDEHSEYEERWITLGKNSNDHLIVVIHTFEEHNEQKATLRIISARKATKHEQKQYEESP
jgi:uncharacterized DUF497 family protein